MPLYEYECPRTGKRFELIQRFSDEPIKKCDDCDQYADCEGECRKILSAPAIQFKGSGWYVTDYAGKGKESKESKEGKSSESKDSGSSGGSKSEGSEKSSKSDSSTSKDSSAPKKDSSGSKSKS